MVSALRSQMYVQQGTPDVPNGFTSPLLGVVPVTGLAVELRTGERSCPQSVRLATVIPADREPRLIALMSSRMPEYISRSKLHRRRNLCVVSMLTLTMSAFVFLAGCTGSPIADSSFPTKPENPTSTIVPPLITTQPANQTVAVGQSGTFSVSASGSAPLGYQWLKNGTEIIGATSATFTTPAAALSDNGTQFTVNVANSVGSITSSAATLTVNAPVVAITVNPNNAAVDVGNSQQFVGSVTGTSNIAVIWSVSGAGCTGVACGTISNNGLYVAPPSVPSSAAVTVKGTSVADPTKSASASLTIVAVASVLLSLNPTSADVIAGGTQPFAASITGTLNTALTWSLSGPACSGSSCGTLSTSTLSSVYSAPNVAPSPATVSVIATSVADPTKSASANVTIVPTVAVSVVPASVSVSVRATQQFVASVTGTSNTAATWTVSGTGCSGTACGTINSGGLYTAPALAPSPPAITVQATSVADSTKSASANVTITPIVGASYYLATAAEGGSDSNSGTSPGSPWLTPDHTLNCGDVIVAAPSSSYSASNFGRFGTVNCALGNNVAWLKCATFDACKITVATVNQFAAGMQIGTSYWGVQGWEVTTSTSSGTCFLAYPASSGTTIHHIVFANDIANGCGEGGFGDGSNGSAGVDYLAYVGDIAYNAVGGSGNCASGFNLYKPVASDSRPGTHIYFAGNFSWNNVEPNPCDGATPTDGEGLLFDNVSPYSQQMVIDNNISVYNGGNGIKAYNNAIGSPNAVIYVRHNTTYGNETGRVNGGICSEIGFQNSLSSEAFANLSMAAVPTGCSGSEALYVFAVSTPDSTDLLFGNYGYSSVANNTSGAGAGYSLGPNNQFGTNPSFANSTAPGTPSCGTATSVPNCMATVIANFTPANAVAKSYGYQIPSPSAIIDPLFAQWLCNVNLPSGLVTMGCLSQ
jgi:hypothetical protein